MDKKTLDQIHLCIAEIQKVRQLIDTKAADDFCGRLLGIYAMMRGMTSQNYGDTPF